MDCFLRKSRYFGPSVEFSSTAVKNFFLRKNMAAGKGSSSRSRQIISRIVGRIGELFQVLDAEQKAVGMGGNLRKGLQQTLLSYRVNNDFRFLSLPGTVPSIHVLYRIHSLLWKSLQFFDITFSDLKNDNLV